MTAWEEFEALGALIQRMNAECASFEDECAHQFSPDLIGGPCEECGKSQVAIAREALRKPVRAEGGKQ